MGCTHLMIILIHMFIFLKKKIIERIMSLEDTFSCVNMLSTLDNSSRYYAKIYFLHPFSFFFKMDNGNVIEILYKCKLHKTAKTSFSTF